MVSMTRTLRDGARTLVALIATSPLLPAGLACAPASDPGGGTDGPGRPRDGGGSDAASNPTDAASFAAANTIACQHLKSGPFSPATGKLMFTYTDPGPAIDNSAKAFRLTLPDPPKAGHFGFKVPSAGEWVIFTSRSVAVQVYTWDGSPLQPKGVAGSVAECTEVKDRESFDLTTDTKPHVIRFGGDSPGTVDVVITAGP